MKALWMNPTLTRPAWSTPPAPMQLAFAPPQPQAPAIAEDAGAVTDAARQVYLRSAKDLAHAQQTLVQEEMEGIIELAFTIGDELARGALSRDRAGTIAAIRASLSELEAGAAQIRVSPADHAAQAAPDLSLVPDASLSDGDFIIATPHERIIDTLENRRESLRRRIGRGGTS
jgi:flagellar biosynthesis/type III secretory pathway protein FliH